MSLFNSHSKTSYTLYQIIIIIFYTCSWYLFKKNKKINDTLFCNWYFFIILSNKNDIIFVTESDF